MRLVLVALATCVLPTATAHAQASVDVTLNQQGRDLAGRLGVTVAALEADAEARIDELYRISRIDDLLRQFADTAAFTQRGLGADYDVDAGDVIFGIAAAGINGDVAIGTTNALAGSVVNLGLLAGVNLGRWNLPRLTVFASGFYETTTVYNLEGHLLTLGSHVQYQIVPAARRARARWTGLAATAGIEYTRWSVGDAGTLVSHFTVRGPSEHKSVQMDSVGTLDVLTTTLTFPLEVTTGVRLFNVLSLYGGAGLSLTTGSSTITAQLESVLSINSDNLPVGNATITGSGESTPSAAAVYALTGLAVHTSHVRVALQGAFASGETSVSIALRAAL